ncbi:MAG: type I 3-dehydroquinate dehydratase [Nitrospirae bacterium]|nr:type I 3-dehydroquinate dehydratase [Nitrospirota bacterium]
MNAVNIGSLVLGERPLIAVALTDRDAAAINTLHGADLIELRIDMFNDLSDHNVKSVFAMARDRFGVPIIATCRLECEGGFRKIAEDDRLELLKAVTGLSDAIDVEINSEIATSVIAHVKQANKTVITSYHNFQHTPPIEELTAIMAKCKQAGGHITKIAVMANSQDDLQTMTLFTIDHYRDNIVTIVMGRLGMASRVFFPLIGSLFTFASIETLSAPGQMPIHDVSKFLR